MPHTNNPTDHTWNVSPQEAVAIQKELRDRVDLSPLGQTLTHPIRTIAGADVSLNRFETDIYAGIIVLSYPDLTPIAHSLVKSKTTFPYVPGLLSFREIPALMEAYEKLEHKPDVVMVDGQGVAHPRRLGIATHFGIVANVPTIGCAKSLLTGTFSEPGLEAGSRSPIYDRWNKTEIIGTALRSKNKTNPLIISAGYKITQEEAVDTVLSCLRGYRLPEPTRLAHELTNKFRRGEITE